MANNETLSDGSVVSYVWVANEKNRLEKRIVELGEYDADLGAYEILSGLTADDYIAWPMEGLYEGVTTVTNEDEVDYSSPLYDQEDLYMDTEFYEDDYYVEDVWGTEDWEYGADEYDFSEDDIYMDEEYEDEGDYEEDYEEDGDEDAEVVE